MDVLYVSDLDGTLLNEQEELPGETMKTLNTLIEKGLLFTFATARSYTTASRVTRGLAVRLPVIVYNGAFLVDGQSGKPLYSCGFKKKEAREAEGIFSEYGLWPLVYSFISGVERVSWFRGRETEGILHYIKKRRTDERLRPVSPAGALYEGDVFYFTCIGSHEQLKPAYEAFMKKEGYRVTLQRELYRDEYWLEIMPEKATKANGLLALKKKLGCGKTVVFGDAENDIPMFLAADASYAVENAVPSLKRIADGLIPSNEECGVAQWLFLNGVLHK